MPLNEKGRKIMKAMQKQYGPEKGKEVFYASENKGSIEGVTRMPKKMDKKKYAMGGMVNTPMVAPTGVSARAPAPAARPSGINTPMTAPTTTTAKVPSATTPRPSGINTPMVAPTTMRGTETRMAKGGDVKKPTTRPRARPEGLTAPRTSLRPQARPEGLGAMTRAMRASAAESRERAGLVRNKRGNKK